MSRLDRKSLNFEVVHLIRDSRDRYTQLYDIIIIEVGFVGGGEGNGVIP